MVEGPLPVSALRFGLVLAIVFAPMTAPAPRMKVARPGRTINSFDVRIRKDSSFKRSKVKNEPLLGDFPFPGERATMTDLERLRHSEPKPFPDVGAFARPRNLKSDPFIDQAIQPPNEHRYFEPGVFDAATLRKIISEELDVSHPIEVRNPWEDTLDFSPVTRDTIVVQPDQHPDGAALEGVAKMASDFLTRVPREQMPDGLTNGITFVVVSRDSNKGYYATICDGKRMRNSEHFIGESILIGGNAPPELLASRLKELAVKGTVFAFGDNDGGTLEQASRKAGLDFVRRGPSLKTDLLKSGQRNAELANCSIDPAQVSFLNGLPTSPDELDAMNFPPSGLEKWKDFHKGVEDRAAHRFGTRLTSKEELLQELRNGSNDIVTIVAHNDGKTFFINGEKLTYRELDRLPQRISPSERPRLCILISCEAVKISDSEPPSVLAFWRKNRESFAELLVRKGFVDRVFAPDHEIQYEETLRVLDHVKSAEKVRDLESLAGWLHLAELLRKLESEPV
jgi:hypothetical protein